MTAMVEELVRSPRLPEYVEQLQRLLAEERARRERQRAKLKDESIRLGAQLTRADFLDRAPAEKVQEIKSRRDELAVQLAAIDRQLEALS